MFGPLTMECRSVRHNLLLGETTLGKVLPGHSTSGPTFLHRRPLMAAFTHARACGVVRLCDVNGRGVVTWRRVRIRDCSVHRRLQRSRCCRVDRRCGNSHGPESGCGSDGGRCASKFRNQAELHRKRRLEIDHMLRTSSGLDDVGGDTKAVLQPRRTAWTIEWHASVAHSDR